MFISQAAAIAGLTLCLLVGFNYVLHGLNNANNALLANGEACKSVMAMLGAHANSSLANTTRAENSSYELHRQPPRRLVSEFIRSIGYKPPGADDASPFFRVEKHPAFDVVIDVGAYHCKDYTMTAYKRGYTVFSFELNPHNAQFCMETFRNEKLVKDVNFTVVPITAGKVPQLSVQPWKPHIYFFVAGVSNTLGSTGMRQGDVMTQVNPDQSGSIPLLRIDDVVPQDARVYVFKSDTQGHEYGVFTGAEKLLTHGKVHLLALEYWPQGSRENGFTSKSVLDYLYDHRFICFDAGTHEYDKVGRPSEIYAFDDFLDLVPRSLDPIGGWEDLVCSRFES